MAGRGDRHRRPTARSPRPRRRVPRRPHRRLLREAGRGEPHPSDGLLPRVPDTLPHGPTNPATSHQSRLGLEAWAAGLFDGEGSVLINANQCESGAWRYNAELKVDMLHEGTIKALAGILGGRIGSYGRRGSTKRVWRWRIAGAATKAAIAALKPYAVTKAAELDILARFLDVKGPGAYTLGQRGACQALKEELEAVRCYTKRAASSSRP